MQTAKSIAGTLRDISAIKMRIIREKFTLNSMFYTEISDLYNLVKLHEAHAHDNDNVPPPPRKQKVLAVAITSNKRFYGLLNNNVVDAFLLYAKQDSSVDMLVVGTTGKQYLYGTEHERKSTYMSFAEDDPTPAENKEFLKRVSGYEKVVVFYPSFVTVFKQEPVMIDITYTTEPKQMSEEKIQDYIFEPEFSQMLAFFEEHIKSLLFNRTMLETELSRTAARLMKMTGAEQSATEHIGEKKRELRKAIESLSNIRLLESFSGLSIWRTK
ncbi:MAG: hypothetical protein UY07_C0014G0008 [Parcubacteria group bacterium GW2011_GWA1_47_8]|uniref:ATP synthase gamma chain n=1 Tax=Candidatus Gottesmanbacteria bacterium GW2011_GWA2_42_18 TaxID=1618442 RepID=A0A0G1C9D0_9BACT|nr:MAG: hypothetical protein UV09_C0020G0005 [Candidatus Gottesmanbacteria bacterium GW2011_GWA2_42_18]KKU81588.1 MAG: hypothetical protein UY07_C0014G0008 [Parcubacteria group bacterium GW2011_GWA1_47_8]